MHRSTLYKQLGRIGGLFAVVIIRASYAGAADIDRLFNAPAWQVDYEVSVACSDSWSQAAPTGSITTRFSLERAFTNSSVLRLRSAGANLAMQKAMTFADGATAPTVAQQAVMQDFIMNGDKFANWVDAGPDIADDASTQEQQGTMREYMRTGMAKVRYERVEAGKGLTDEIGKVFDHSNLKTEAGSGAVVPMQKPTFELDSRTKHYYVTLPLTYNSDSDTAVSITTIDSLHYQGEAPTETRNNQKQALQDFLGAITLDEPTPLLNTLPFFEGDLDPATGQVTGERKVAAHYTGDGREVPVTVVFKYTAKPVP